MRPGKALAEAAMVKMMEDPVGFAQKKKEQNERA